MFVILSNLTPNTPGSSLSILSKKNTHTHKETEEPLCSVSGPDFPGGPVVRTLRFQCREHGFDPWSGH